MIFHQINDDDHYFHRIRSETGLIEIAVHRVMFGWRVVGMFHNTFGIEINWCAGDRWEDVIKLYSILHAILSNRPENRHAFDGIPQMSKVKPYFKDPDFLGKVAKITPERVTTIPLEQPCQQFE